MQSQGSVRVLIADNQPVLREGLNTVLMQQPDLKPIGQATSEAEALALCQWLQPDVIVVDGTLHVARIVKRLRKRAVSCKVVALVEPVANRSLSVVVRSGVDGVVSLKEPPEKIVEAIRTVAKGSKYLPEVGPAT